MTRFESAKEIYASLGVDAEKALETLKNTVISVHCWQGDDVVGFDSRQAASGGIQTTGNYPGRAATPEELMADFDEVLKLCSGKFKLNIHASYAIFDGEKAGRNELEPKHFAFQCGNNPGFIVRYGENLIQRLFHPLTGSLPVGGIVLQTIGHPVIYKAGLTQFVGKILRDLQTAFAVLDPILPYLLLRGGESKPVHHHRM